MLRPIRAVIIDDSAFMRKIIEDILASDPDIEVVAKGRNGKDAVELVEKFKPDVITLDIEMPVMNGLDALSVIMKTHPLPVLMLSSLTSQGATETIRALEMGAVDFISKPSGAISLDLHKVGADIIKKVKAAAQVNITHLRKGSEMLSRIHQRSIASRRVQQLSMSATDTSPNAKTMVTPAEGARKTSLPVQGGLVI
ncbi:response regulator [Aneurinibacillus soli]|uniref:Chemotaxis response regulator protein-glutamate methylesterase n=1 Tax=Aneurinibacillus soli TaxID=1500254 RepID=A0A0U4WG71_9BACL|nr:response regulator [Aneurinibacillus soli]BAU27689.1 Chemotaxis response regulator protein-glutamate methylesterase [Aneurinibacillus soli]